MDCGEEKESFMLVWRNHQLLFGFLTNDHFLGVTAAVHGLRRGGGEKESFMSTGVEVNRWMEYLQNNCFQNLVSDNYITSIL